MSRTQAVEFDPERSTRRSTRSPGCSMPANDDVVSTPSVIALRPGRTVLENRSVSYGSSTSVHKTGSPGSIAILARAPTRSSTSETGKFLRPVPEEGISFFARFRMRNVSPAGIGTEATTTSTGLAWRRMSFSTVATLRPAAARANPHRRRPASRGRSVRILPASFPEKKERALRFIDANNGSLLSASKLQHVHPRGIFSGGCGFPARGDQTGTDGWPGGVQHPENEVDRRSFSFHPEGVLRGQSCRQPGRFGDPRTRILQPMGKRRVRRG